MKSLIPGVMAIAYGFVTASCSDSNDPASSRSTNSALDGYLKVSEALFQDDLVGAKSAAAEVAAGRQSPFSDQK